MLAIFQDGFWVRMKHRLHLLVGAFWTSCSCGYKGICTIGLAGLVGWWYKENGTEKKDHLHITTLRGHKI